MGASDNNPAPLTQPTLQSRPFGIFPLWKTPPELGWDFLHPASLSPEKTLHSYCAILYLLNGLLF